MLILVHHAPLHVNMQSTLIARTWMAVGSVRGLKASTECCNWHMLCSIQLAYVVLTCPGLCSAALHSTSVG